MAGEVGQHARVVVAGHRQHGDAGAREDRQAGGQFARALERVAGAVHDIAGQRHRLDAQADRFMGRAPPRRPGAQLRQRRQGLPGRDTRRQATEVHVADEQNPGFTSGQRDTPTMAPAGAVDTGGPVCGGGPGM